MALSDSSDLENAYDTEPVKKMYKALTDIGKQSSKVGNLGDQERLNSVQMDFLRPSAGISKLQHIPNIEVNKIMKIEKSVIDEIQTRRLKWYELVRLTTDQRWPKKMLEWVLGGRRRKGRLKEEWYEQINKSAI
ncbi:hypothetical protein ILUMI_13951 [Ignelater luminosus]|uniref:Uncharacterized protein n=1 Tax=Ignelater luminosus TaxID=2038154 RepID=A0A8K0CXI0_IGNLU|nr:hypothetical protein ILUMI_13951 [Ignelater luminosus]